MVSIQLGKGSTEATAEADPALRLPEISLLKFYHLLMLEVLLHLAAEQLHIDAKRVGVLLLDPHLFCKQEAQMHDKTVVEGFGGAAGSESATLGSSVPLCLRVDRGHVAQAAVEAAHREVNALLGAGGELAPGASLQLLAQAEACERGQHRELVGSTARRRAAWGDRPLTCSASVATRHVEAILRMRGVGLRILRDLDASARRLVGLSEMEAALKGALVL